MMDDAQDQEEAWERRLWQWAGVWGTGHGGGWGQSCSCRATGGKAEDKEWLPIIMSGHLIKDMKIKSLGGDLPLLPAHQ